LAFTAMTFLLAGFVKGVIGMGLPTVAIGLLCLVMTPAQAAALLIVPTLVTNVWQAMAGDRFTALLRRLWPMLLGTCVGTALGGGLLTGDEGGRALAALGIVLVLYAAVGLSSIPVYVPPRLEPWLS